MEEICMFGHGLTDDMARTIRYVEGVPQCICHEHEAAIIQGRTPDKIPRRYCPMEMMNVPKGRCYYCNHHVLHDIPGWEAQWSVCGYPG